jgi:hypothetical protein
MAADPENLHTWSPAGLLVLFGTLQFHIESLEEWEGTDGAEPERLAAYRKQKDEVRAVICHGAPRKPPFARSTNHEDGGRPHG